MREIEDSSWSWRIVILVGIVFSLPLGIGVLFCTESPRWLMGQGRAGEAKLAMAKLRGMKDDPNNPLVERDFREMQEGIEKEKSVGNASWLECLTGKPSNITRLAYRTYLGCALQFLQVRCQFNFRSSTKRNLTLQFGLNTLKQWTGVNYFFYYLSEKRRKSESTG